MSPPRRHSATSLSTCHTTFSPALSPLTSLASATNLNTFSQTSSPFGSVLLSPKPCRVAFDSLAPRRHVSFPFPWTIWLSSVGPTPPPHMMISSFSHWSAAASLLSTDLGSWWMLTTPAIVLPGSVFCVAVSISAADAPYSLPAHKADRFFESNLVIITRFPSSPINPLTVFLDYLRSRNSFAPLHGFTPIFGSLLGILYLPAHGSSHASTAFYLPLLVVTRSAPAGQLFSPLRTGQTTAFKRSAVGLPKLSMFTFGNIPSSFRPSLPPRIHTLLLEILPILSPPASLPPPLTHFSSYRPGLVLWLIAL